MASKLTRFSLTVLLVSLFGLSNLFSQVTLVNYDFNSTSAYPAVPSAVVTNITSSGNSTEAFQSFTGAATTAGAFTANSTAGNAIAMQNSSSTGNKYFTFTLGGSALANYKTFKVYFQAQRSASGSPTVTVQYSLNGAAYTTFASNTMSPGNGSFNATTIILPAAVDNPTTLDIRLYPGGGTGGTLRMDNFQVQGVLSPLAPSLTIANNGLQPNAASVFQSSNDNILQRFIVTEGNVAAGTLNTLTVPLAGTYSASDIDALGLKLYAGTANNFASATLISSKTSASSGSGETVTFSSLNYAIAKNTARYFWVTTDIAAAAIAGKTINASALNTGNFTFAAGTKAGSVSAGGVQTITALVASLNITNNGTQPAAAAVLQNTNDNILQRFIITEGNIAAGTLNSVDIPLVGTYLASDINGLGLKLYGGTANNFASATLLSSQASTSPGSGETVSFSSLNYAIAKNTARYFWVTADIDASGIVGNDINAAALNAGNFSFAAGTVTVSVNAGGTQTILAPDPSLDIVDNGAQPAAAFVLQNTNDHILQSFTLVEGNVAAATLNAISVPLLGTYVASDINGAGLKLYSSTTNNFASATVLDSQTSTSSGSGETAIFAFNLGIAKNSTHYFWVTADIDASATVGNTIHADALNAGSFSFAAGAVTVSVNAGGVQTITAAAITTQLRTSYCGYAAESFGEFIGADSVLTANHYRFQLVNAATSYTQTFTNSSGYPYLTLYTIPGISYNTTYTVTVAWSADGISWSPYGSPCSITSPTAEVTELQPAYCGYTATTYPDVIYANRVSGATQYEYKLVNAALGYSQSYVKTNSNFNLAQFTGLTNATTYSVSVRVFIFGAWDIYGTECNVTTPSAIPTTSLQPSYCGVTATAYTQVLYAEYIGAATQYEYKLANTVLGYSQTYVKTNNNFNLAQFTGLTNGTTYSVSIRVNVNNTWGNYGAVCHVTTPSSVPTTSLQPTSCGITTTAYTQVLYAEYVGAATQYEYRLANTTLGYSQTYVKTNNNFNLGQFTSLANGTTYSVSVRVNVNNTWGSFGPVCQVTTPSVIIGTSLQPAYCGITATAYTQVLYANNVTGATQYEYKLENTALGYIQTYVKTNGNFNLAQFTGLANSTTYSVSIRVNVNNTWGNYGAVCNVTTPSSVPTTSLQPAYCGITATAYNQVLYANAVAGATQYEYRLENTALGYSQTYVKLNNNFNLTQFTGLTNSTTYSVSLRVNISGIWGAYGPACTVTTPSSARMASREGINNADNNLGGNNFDAMAYPNPFNSEFSLNLLSYSVNESINIRVFDATGKLMEEHQTMPESVKDLNIGSAYAQGLYNIVISQGAQTKSIKVIRQ